MPGGRFPTAITAVRWKQGDYLAFEGGPADSVVYEIDADGDAIFYGHRVEGEIVRVS